MNLSPAFHQLRAAYQAEMDDLSFDSEGRDVLRQRLADKRQSIDFLLQMTELAPEMVAVVFHQAFRFKEPGVMDQVVSLELDDCPDWDEISGTVQLAPWAAKLADIFAAGRWPALHDRGCRPELPLRQARRGRRPWG